MAIYQKTVEQFETLLKCDIIDLKRLKILAFNGCPAENGIRSLTWKVLLNYLVLDRTKWSSHLSKQRELYRGYIRETIIKPGLTPTTEADFVDHPLNSAPDSSWAVYFKENEVLLQIDKDVRRLCPDLSFFQRETDYPCSEILNQEAGFESLRKRIVSTALKVESQSQSRLTGRLEFEYQNKKNHSSTSYDDNEYQLLPDGHEAHWEVVERILFVFSKLNSGQSYVQGMNEIIGPIYYTFATDPNLEWREHAEADAFYCFTNLMIHIRDNFMKIYDHSEFGILPLNSAPDSSWAVYFKENEVLLQIDKDVRRLCPDLSFFQRETDYPCSEILNQEAGFESLRKRIVSTALKVESQSQSRLTGRLEFEYQNKKNHSSTSYDDNEYQLLPDGHEAHWEVVERILFVFSKLNSGQSYVQGMNEIIGPIYYTFATDPNLEWREHAEADAFYCFTNLMIHIRDNFMKIYDHSEFGILVRMQRFLMLLKKTDHDIHYLFEKQKLKPEFYAFRWLTLLLSQEFRLPDVLRIWDSLFADQERNFEFLLYICCAMIVLQRTRLLTGSESQNIKLLQNYPQDIDVHQILEKAVELKRLYLL
ncbi:unnamed protein product [Adineta steineri]|uniref:TBC1 domain family member 13 n=1 Tax=Adineta steineri TaxID=433720 RepID=A0A815CRZ1_9BILA|nr:unnamed protein product [Adineta steineri]